MSDIISINFKFDEKAFLKEAQKHIEQEVKKASKELSRQMQRDASRTEQQPQPMQRYFGIYKRTEPNLPQLCTKKPTIIL